MLIHVAAISAELKALALEVYNRRLKERLEKRAFVIENDLVEQKKVFISHFDLITPGLLFGSPVLLHHYHRQKQSGGRKTKEELLEEKEITRSMQKFLQLHGKDEHEPFVDGLVRTRSQKSNHPLLSMCIPRFLIFSIQRNHCYVSEYSSCRNGAEWELRLWWRVRSMRRRKRGM